MHALPISANHTFCDQLLFQNKVPTFLDGSSTTRLRQTVALTDGTTETDVHELLCVLREGSATRKHHANTATEQRAHLLEDEPRNHIKKRRF